MADSQDKPAADGIDRRTPSRQLDETYLDAAGKARIEAIEAKVARIRQLERAAFVVYCSQAKTDVAVEKCGPLFDGRFLTLEQPLIAKWAKRRLTIGYNYAAGELQAAVVLARALAAAGADLRAPTWTNRAEAHEFYERLFNGVEAFEASVNEDPNYGSLFRAAKEGARTIKPVTIRAGRAEATNLVAPAGFDTHGQLFVSPADLIARGVDLSSLDPPDSGLWRRPRAPISSFDTARYGGAANSPGFRSVSDTDREVKVVFEKFSSGGRTPKFQARIDGKLAKIKFYPGRASYASAMEPVGAVTRLFEGSEVHTETAVNNLAAALGFSVDPTYFKKSARLYFADAGTDAEFEKARAKFAAGLVDTDDMADFGLQFKDVRVDDEGRRFIQLTNLSVEFYSQEGEDQDTYLGLFVKDTQGRALKREFRAFQLFYAWINDIDNKDQNSDMKIVPTADGRTKLVFSASDMGAALGSNFSKDKPNGLLPDLVAASTSKVILLTYRTFHDVPLFDAVSMADARWFARLLGQLTTAQLRAAFAAAGYPDPVRELYVQKLLRRRDQLVGAVGLQGELPPLSLMKDPRTYSVPGYESLFKDGQLVALPGVDAKEAQIWAEHDLREAGQALATTLLAKGLKAVGRQIQYFSADTKLIGGVRVGTNTFLPARYLIANPDQASDKPWWVVDVFRVGVDLTRPTSDLIDRFGIHEMETDVSLAKIRETIRVRPTADPAREIPGALKLYDPRMAFTDAFDKIDADDIAGMQPGDVLLANTYDVIGGSVRADAMSYGLPFVKLGPFARLGGQLRASTSVVVAKTADDEVLAGWKSLRDAAASLQTGVQLLLFKLPLYSERLDVDKITDRVYRFDPREESDRLALARNLSRAKLDDATEARFGLGRQSRESRIRTSKRAWSLFGYARHGMEDRSITISYDDRSSGKSGTVRSEQRSRERGLFLGGFVRKSAEATIVEGARSELFLRMVVGYKRTFATRPHLAHLKQTIMPMFPSSLMPFEAEDANFYLGTLELDGEILFSQPAVEEILANAAKAPLCERFAATIPYQLSGEAAGMSWCAIAEELRDPVKRMEFADRRVRDPDERERFLDAIDATAQFTSRMRKLGEAWSEAPGSRETLRSMAKLIDGAIIPECTIRTLLSLTDGSKVRRTAEMTSSLDGFPGQESRLSVNARQRGGAAARGSVPTIETGAAPTDPYYQALRPLMYDYFYQNSVASPPQ